MAKRCDLLDVLFFTFIFFFHIYLQLVGDYLNEKNSDTVFKFSTMEDSVKLNTALARLLQQLLPSQGAVADDDAALSALPNVKQTFGLVPNPPAKASH